MGCCGEREKGLVKQEQRWEYITLSDFQSRSCGMIASYIWLWILVIVSCTIVAVDTFTAINLLAFNRWSSQVKPVIPFTVSKWIFAVCILLSFVFLAYEWVRAIRVIRRGAVAEDYLDPLAVILQSIRPQGWRRFQVFAALTKSRKGTDYIALFVYFSFKGAFQIVLAEAPRQAVNAMTLYSVMQADLLPQGKHSTVEGRAKIVQFFINVQILAKANDRQAAILFGMLFSLVIWVIGAITLALSFLIFILYLWHHIPARDGRLSVYCRRKINKRVDKLVADKVQQVMEQQEKQRLKEQKKAAKKGAPVPGDFKRQPTLPDMGLGLTSKDEEAFDMPSLKTQPSFATLPTYSSNPTTPADELSHQPTLPHIDDSFTSPVERTATMRSTESDLSNAPLVGAAMPMGTSDLPLRAPMERSLTNGSYGSARPGPGGRMGATPAPSYRSATDPFPRGGPPSNNPYGPPRRQDTQSSVASSRAPPSRTPTNGRPYPPPGRSNTGRSGPYGPPSRSNTDISMGTISRPPPTRSNTGLSSNPSFRQPPPPTRTGTAMSGAASSYRGGPTPAPSTAPSREGAYTPFAARYQAAPSPSSTYSSTFAPAPGSRGPPQSQRNFTAPGASYGGNGAGAAASHTDIYDDYYS